MESRVVDLKCPNCGDSVAINQTECRCCHQPLIISSFNSVYSMPFPKVNRFVGLYKETLKQNPSSEVNKSIAMCYLKLKFYDEALRYFEKAIADNFDDSETYFYAAVCVQGGKKAFFHQRPAIDKILKYINGALMIESKMQHSFMRF